MAGIKPPGRRETYQAVDQFFNHAPQTVVYIISEARHCTAFTKCACILGVKNFAKRFGEL